MNDIETTKETGFKVHKLPTSPCYQRKLTEGIDFDIQPRYEYPNKHYIWRIK